MKRMNWIRRLAVLVTAGMLSVAGAATSFAATRLAQVQDAWWDEDHITKATWEEVEDASEYQVYLYCEESKVAEIKTKKLFYDFKRKMTKEGDYTFRVRALAKGSDYRDGSWSESSDETYIGESYAELMRNNGVIDVNTAGPGAKQDGSQATKESMVLYREEWVQDSVGWWYRRSDGSYPASTWWQDPANAVWYYFNEQGYMATGWIDWNGERYYCQPDGAMVTGEQTIDGAVYRFDDSGALLP